MEVGRRRTPSEVLKRGYTDDELSDIYELGRFLLENGDLRRAEVVMLGLSSIAPDFGPAWLGLSCIHYLNKRFDAGVQAARNALKATPKSCEVLLALVAGLMTNGDFNAAGTHLGEVGELIDGGVSDDPNVIRFYRGQLARFQNR